MNTFRHMVGKIVSKFNGNLYTKVQQRLMYRRYLSRKSLDKSQYADVLEKDYIAITGKPLDLKHPQSYTEKIQWLKLFDDNVDRTRLADKVAVREWIKSVIGEKYLIPIIGVYDHFDEIDFEKLPSRFVIKTNHSSGWNIIVTDKSTFNKKKAKKIIERWLSLDYGLWTEFEIHYSAIPPRIIIEQYVTDSNGELNDYKFLCFNGECKYFWMDFDRQTNHKRNIYDMKWNLQPWNQSTYGNYSGDVKKPDNFDDMVRIANILCKGFKHVRVDLYNVDGKVYFGEMTFTNGSGFEGIYPTEYDYELGKLITLPTDKSDLEENM